MREKARQTSCLSNCKQLGLAVEQYKADYDQGYPYALTCGLCGLIHSDQLPFYWYIALQAYTGNKQIQYCPSGKSSWTGTGYSYNYYMFGRVPGANAGNPCGGGFSEARVKNPAEKVLIVDRSVQSATYLYYLGLACDTCQQGIVCWMPYYLATVLPTKPEAAKAAGVHNGGVNCVYADGHAKWQTVTAIVTSDLAKVKALFYPWE